MPYWNIKVATPLGQFGHFEVTAIDESEARELAIKTLKMAGWKGYDAAQMIESITLVTK